LAIADIPVLIVTPPAIGELFVNVTAYELAYTRSPARMKGFVYSFTLFNQAISAAVALALAGVIRDPWLVWPWVAMACITFCVAWVFPTYFKHLNVPMKDFANRDRQAGLHQPKVIGEEKAAAGGVSQ
jgi:POT family proton-dependent oligopeptide transporter